MSPTWEVVPETLNWDAHRALGAGCETARKIHVPVGSVPPCRACFEIFCGSDIVSSSSLTGMRSIQVLFIALVCALCAFA